MRNLSFSHRFLSLPTLLTLGALCVSGATTGAPGEPSAATSLRQLLEKTAATDPYAFSLRRIYQSRRFQPLWRQDNGLTVQAQALIKTIERADDQGLNPADYDAAQLSGWTTEPPTTPSAWSQLDLTLSRASMRYADHLRRGRIPHAALNELGIDIPAKPPLNFPQLLDELSQSLDPGQTLQRLAPDTQAYAALSAALPHYRKLAEQPRPTPLTLSKSLRPGETRDEVAHLRTLLQTHGYENNAPPASPPEWYDEALAETVRRFQLRHGLAADAVVGGQTLAQLNTSPAARVAQIRLGLERLRWLPERHDNPYLIVNVPSFRLYGYVAGAPDFAKPDIAMDVIVGQAIDTHNTPIFHADMQFVVFRPYWNVPYSIAHNELLPLIEKTADYLAKNDMEIVGNDGDDADPEDSPENLDEVDSGQYRLRQRPGPKNALGPIKFVFPNMNSVYMHGTPKPQLFQRARRDLSHGCIRLSDPAGLAEFVLKKENGWDRPRIESAMQGDKSFSLRLSRNIPVYIFYTTALADDQGQVLFYPDIYAQDAALLKLLNPSQGKL